LSDKEITVDDIDNRSEEGFINQEMLFHLLISCFSDSTMAHVFELGLEGDDERDPNKIIEGLSGLLSGRKNHHLYRHDFNLRVQQPDESFDS
jgi:hypothetical protein